jgi:hypothetical protein
LRELRRLGIISSESLSVTAFAMFGMINWCYRWYRDNGGLTIEDVAQRLIDLLFHGIMKSTETSEQ